MRKISDHFKQNAKSTTVSALLEKYILATRSSTAHESPHGSVTATVAQPPPAERSTSPSTAPVVTEPTTVDFDRSRTTATQPLPQTAFKGLYSPKTGPLQDPQTIISSNKPKQVPYLHKRAVPQVPSPTKTTLGQPKTRTRWCTPPQNGPYFTTYYGGFATNAGTYLLPTYFKPFRPYRSDRYFYKSPRQQNQMSTWPAVYKPLRAGEPRVLDLGCPLTVGNREGTEPSQSKGRQTEPRQAPTQQTQQTLPTSTTMNFCKPPVQLELREHVYDEWSECWTHRRRFCERTTSERKPAHAYSHGYERLDFGRTRQKPGEQRSG